VVVVLVAVDGGESCEASRCCLEAGSDSSRSVGEMACASDLRLVVREDDIRRMRRLARPDFFSRLSSPLEGEAGPRSGLDGDRIEA